MSMRWMSRIRLGQVEVWVDNCDDFHGLGSELEARNSEFGAERKRDSVSGAVV